MALQGVDIRLSQAGLFGGVRHSMSTKGPRGHCIARHQYRLGCSVVVCGKTPSESQNAQPFFNRQQELRYFLNGLSLRPMCITVIVGPVGAGKTAFLQHARQLLEDRGVGVAFVNTGNETSRKPSELAIALGAAAKGLVQLNGDALSQRWRDLLEEIGSIRNWPQWPHGGFSWHLTKLFGRSPSADTYTLANVLEAYMQLLESNPPNSHPPVIIIDDANTFAKWGPEAHPELRMLLNSFLLVAPKKSWAHVVLATSDSSFIKWLLKRWNCVYFSTDVIGDFSFEHGLEFLQQQLPAASHRVVAKHWERIFEVCGGNAGTLTNFADSYLKLHHVEEALVDVMVTTCFALDNAAAPGGTACWTVAQYRTVVDALVNNKYHAVPYKQLAEQLGTGGSGVIHALLEARVLSLRLWSSWPRDIPEEAWDDLHTLVMAGSALHMYVMKAQRLDYIIPVIYSQYTGNSQPRLPPPK